MRAAKKRISIIFPDKLVLVDDRAYPGLDIPEAPGVQVLHWDVTDGRGTIEFKGRKLPEEISGLSAYRHIIDAIQVQIDGRDA